MTEFQSLDKWFGQSKWLMALLLLNNLKKICFVIVAGFNSNNN